MYAEERQQAMAQLITQRGRVSVAELAEKFSVTTETVRRDLSALERMGLVRRVHGGAVPSSSLAVIESGLARARPGQHRREGAGSPRPPCRCCPRRAPPSCWTPAPPPAAWPPAPPRPAAHRRHPRGADRGPPGGHAPDRPPPAARPRPAPPPRPRSAPTPSRHWPTCGPTWRSSATNGLTVRARAHHARPGRGRHQARHRRRGRAVVVLADSTQDRRGVDDPVRRRSTRSTSWSPTARSTAADRRPASSAAGVEVVVGVILTLTPNPSIDRTVTLAGPLARGAGPAGRGDHLAGRRQGRQHLARLGQRRPSRRIAVLPAARTTRS